jgi:TetR/AcrR family transcriptional regulator, regulator of cefoperazone and chloramphenicol sensitivity
MSRRSYHSPRRQQQADETRQRVVEAARALFLERGFDGTTIDAVAEQAGVSAPTVYAAFGNKKGLVAGVLDRARFGATYAEVVQQAHATADPVERLGYVARIARSIYEAESAELDVLRGAGISPELVAMEREEEGARYESQRGMVEGLADAGRLRPGLDPERARDVLWALTSRGLFRGLVSSRGWTADDYEAWLGPTLVEALTGPEAP